MNSPKMDALIYYRINVKVLEGNDFKNKPHYCSVICDATKGDDPILTHVHFQTKVVSSKTPKWNSSFDFWTSKLEGYIIIKIKKRNWFLKNSLVGTVGIPIRLLSEQTNHTSWFEVDEGKAKENGKEPSKTPQISVSISILSKVRVKGGGYPISPQPGKSVELEKEGDNQKIVPDHNLSTGSSYSSNHSGLITKPHLRDSSSFSSNLSSPKLQKDSLSNFYTYSELCERYIIVKEIGKGGFSTVMLGIHKASGVHYAVKIVNKSILSERALRCLEREIEILRTVNHPNIIRLKEVIESPRAMYIITEYAPGGELFEKILLQKFFSEKEAATLVIQLLASLKHIHSLSIAHRDLKLENILIGEDEKGNEVYKICDFGLSREFKLEMMCSPCGTPDYVAPEVILGEEYDCSVDMWSLGVITYILLSGKLPFGGNTNQELFSNILGGIVVFPEEHWKKTSKEAKDFISKLLLLDPKQRMTAEQALNHKWIQKFNKIKQN